MSFSGFIISQVERHVFQNMFFMSETDKVNLRYLASEDPDNNYKVQRDNIFCEFMQIEFNNNIFKNEGSMSSYRNFQSVTEPPKPQALLQ